MKRAWPRVSAGAGADNGRMPAAAPAALLLTLRIDNDAATINARTFAVERVFAHVLRRHEPETRARRITVATAIEDQADQAVADPERIEEVVDNLFANALRYTPAGGHIALRAEGEDGGEVIVLSVAFTPALPRRSEGPRLHSTSTNL